MSQEKKELNREWLESEIAGQEGPEEKPPFVPSPKWKRVAAWVLFGIMVLGIVNWLLSIAFPHWPQWVMERFS